MRRLRDSFAVALAAALLSGCGERFGSVEGTASYDGKPLPSGTVTFHYSDGRVETAPIQPDGKYMGPRVLAGKVRISVQTPNAGRLGPALAKALKSGDQQTVEAARRDGATIVPSVNIPDRYNDPATSGLEVVVDGDVKFDLQLTK